MYEIDFSRDTETVVQNKMFNNLQFIRGDISVAASKGMAVDSDTLKVAEAVAREIRRLQRKMEE